MTAHVIEIKTMIDEDGTQLYRWRCSCSALGAWSGTIRGVRRGGLAHQRATERAKISHVPD